MCGIAGYLGDFDRRQLKLMTRTLEHRGPDDEGYYYDGPVGLGHRRLSIVDLAGGHQPLSNEDGTVWVTFNGEIYNHEELRKNLRENHEFRSRSDTEILVHLYEEFGVELVHHLRGMFAFAIWDTRLKRLFLARDRFGIKPLYYARGNAGFLFASEAKGILASGFIEPRVNRQALPTYLDFRYVPGRDTMFDGIYKLEPGHYLTVEEGKPVTTERYWALDFSAKEQMSEREAADRLMALLTESVDLRLMSDVPLGSFLSGGLDSSLIVGIMSGLVADSVSTFTACLEGDWHDESEFAALVARHFGTKHHPLRIEADASAVLDQVIWHLDEPLGDAATIPTYLLSELTRKYVTVALTGEGADELLAGYDKYKAIRYGDPVRRLIGGPHFRALNLIGKAHASAGRAVDFFSQRHPVAAYRALTAVFSDREKKELIHPRAGMAWDPEHWSRFAGASLDRVQGPAGDLDVLDRLMHLDVQTWLPNDVLLKADKMSMAHSLEARVPFLDHKLAEFVVSVPNRLKLKWLNEKYILRRAMDRLVPESIVRRRKHGFTVPVARWMAGELRPMVHESLNEDRIRELGFWEPAYVTALLAEDHTNEYRRRQLWTLFTFDRWHRTFIEGSGSPNRA